MLLFISPVSPVAGVEAEGDEILILDAAGGTVRDCAEVVSRAALAIAEARVVRPPSGGGEERIGCRGDFIFQGNEVTIQGESVELARGLETASVEVRNRESTGLAVILGVGLRGEDDVGAIIHCVDELRRAIVEVVVAIFGPEPVALTVVVVNVVAEFSLGAFHRSEAAEEPVIAADVLGVEGKWLTRVRTVGDEVECATRLRAVLESRAAMQKLDVIHGF